MGVQVDELRGDGSLPRPRGSGRGLAWRPKSAFTPLGNSGDELDVAPSNPRSPGADTSP